ncbi:hypothetical protein DS745_20820 [Anaerobacillus alkaliphilus]|uniref:Carboxypeptidase regulatory-like domain-containing protein n=1 Tax=Anaerobacillus alkaliphilus TaxID=1548597 RepID=A0A4Q0VLB4_9BACI|nr:hypothetical protein [Anaerobacillus alkaliphilus]RXI96188.1 hypothetical protein DS745_20820 [Anaerobacillus alkaliphilus]
MIKMKMKHLIAGVLVLLSFSIVFVFVLQPILQGRVISHEVSRGNVDGAKQQIIKQIEKDRINSLKLIKDYMIERHPTGNRYDVYIGPSMSSWGSVTGDRIFTLEESLPYLQIYLDEAPADGYLRRTVEILVSYYESLGDFEHALSVFEKALQRFSTSSFVYHELELKRIELAINLNHIADAELFIEAFEGTVNEVFTDIPLQLARLKAELFVQKGKLAEAVAILSVAIDDYEEWNESFKKELKMENDLQSETSWYPSYETAIMYREQVERLMNDNGQLGTVVGKVIRSDGEPLSNVGIFLREEHVTNQSVSEYERYQTVTKPDGSFSFTGVIPGSYQIHVGFMFDQIDGWSWPVEMDDWLDVKATETFEYEIEITPLISVIEPTNYQIIRNQEITFAWEPFPGATSYTLHGGFELDGSSTGFQVISGIKDSEVTISVEELYSLTTGIMFSGDNWTSVKPESLLGFANIDGLFSWSVKAFNERGQLIGQSNGYRLREETMGPLPFYHLKARELTDADQVFLTGKIEEALEMYKENVEINPHDIHSLRMVARMIGLDRKNEQQALPYWLALAEQSQSSEYAITLAQLYFDQENWSEFEKWYQLAGDVSSYAKSIYARALMKQGKLEESRESFHEIMEEDRSNRFVGLLLAIEIYLEKDYNTAQYLAEKYKERSYEAKDWLAEIRKLEKEVPIEIVTEELGKFFIGEKVEANDLAKYPELAQFLRMLERVN